MPLRPLAAAAAATVAVLALGTPAPAAGVPVRIVAPAADAWLAGSPVQVQVRTERAAPPLRVIAYGPRGRRRNVTARFTRTGRGRFRGRLRVGRELGVGRNSVFAEIRGRRGTITARHFNVARLAEGRVRIRRVGAGADRHGPLRVRVHAPGDVLRARLNGRAVGGAFEPLGRDDRWRATLTGRHGLRYGRNRLAVSVFDGNRFRRVRISYGIGRGRPIADAGADRRVLAGARIRLDGRRTRRARAAELRLRWRIVAQPKGSRARLRNVHRERPRLVTDRNGIYRIRLEAAHRPGGRARAAQAPAASSDTVTVQAAPDYPPEGAPVQTIATQNGQVGILAAGVFSPMPAGAAVQLVEVDRTTLAVTSTGFAAGQEQALLTAVDALDSRTLVILSAGGRGPYDAPSAVQQAIQKIGGVLDDYGDSPIGQIDELTNGNGGWSVIGIPGAPQGQAYQLIGLQQSAGAPAGGMSGQLRQGANSLQYTFSWTPEYHTYDTNLSQTPASTSNTMTVGQTSYPSAALPYDDGRNAKIGYQLLWFDADTLQLRGNFTYDADPASSYAYTPDYHGMNGLLFQLKAILSDPKPGLIFMNTIGSVPTLYFNGVPNKSDGNDWRGEIAARVTTVIEQFGANRWTFTLHGSGIPGPGTPGGYSLVGLSGLRYLKGPNAGAELSTRLNANTQARLAGVLKRSRQGVLTAGTSGVLDPGEDAADVQPALGQILAEPDQPFEPFEGPALSQAEQYIADQLNLDLSHAPWGLRWFYWNIEDPTTWQVLKDRLTDPDNKQYVNPCKSSPCAAGFAEVRDTLVSEIEDVMAVQGYFIGSDANGLGSILSTVFQAAGGLGLTQLAKDVRDAYKTQRTDGTSGPDALGILGGTLGIVSGLGEFIPEIGQEIAAAATVTAGVTEIIGATAQSESDSGDAAFDPYGFQTTMNEIDSDLYDAYQQGLGSLTRTAELLVSDAGRLSAAATWITADPAQGGWEISGDQAIALKARLTRSLRQYMWLTIGQPVLATYECAAEDIAGVRRHNPGAVLATNVNFPLLKSPNDLKYHEWWNLYPTSIVLGSRNAGTGWPVVTSASITGDLFGEADLQNYPPANDNAGFQPEYFFDRARADYGPNNRAHFNYDIQPVSPGIVHKNMNMSGNEEDSSGLAYRDNFSMYTPSCGNGQKLRWSDPDPNAPDSLDPTQPPEGDPGGALWDVAFNPYKNP